MATSVGYLGFDVVYVRVSMVKWRRGYVGMWYLRFVAAMVAVRLDDDYTVMWLRGYAMLCGYESSGLCGFVVTWLPPF